MGLLFLGVPVAAALALLLFKEKRMLSHVINVSASFLMLLLGVYFTTQVIAHAEVRLSGIGGAFYLDSFSILILDLVLAIGFFATVYAVGYLENEIRAGVFTNKKISLFYALLQAFFFTMALALTTENLGILWIAIEATTLSSAFLVGFHNDKHSLEAAWKYVIICSVGIAIALLGIILLHLSSIDVLSEEQLLNWNIMKQNAPLLKAPLVRIAFLFILIGFGTKAGLAPMHTWLPDAHSQAPSPVSALLSGVLLNSAMYAIIRVIAIVNQNQGESTYTGRLMIGMGILSILTAAIFLLTQKDYKRLLAYSSIEHMGIIAIAIGFFTPLSVLGGMLHMVNHSLTKSMLFFTSGNILQQYHTRKISTISGLLTTMPATGVLFLLGILAIAGTPPFSIFASEFQILSAMILTGKIILPAIILILLAIVFSGMAVTLFPMLFGLPKQQNRSEVAIEILPNRSGTLCLFFMCAVILMTGIVWPDVVTLLLTRASELVVGR